MTEAGLLWLVLVAGRTWRNAFVFFVVLAESRFNLGDLVGIEISYIVFNFYQLHLFFLLSLLFVLNFGLFVVFSRLLARKPFEC